MAFSVLRSIYRGSASLPLTVSSASRSIKHGSILERFTISSNSSTNLCRPCNTELEQRRHYAMRLKLTEHGIVWRRPEYIPSWKPEKSGDLEPHLEPDLSRPSIELLPAEDTFNALQEETKRYLSLEMQPKREVMKICRLGMLKKVQRHKYDVCSIECQVAMLTVKIRRLQDKVAKDKRAIRTKIRLDELIARRKTLLKRLRLTDYKRFEWLLETLNLQYKPFPVAYHQITRKNSLRKLVQLHKEDIKRERLEELKENMKTLKEEFLKEKAETLEWIAKTETELKLRKC